MRIVVAGEIDTGKSSLIHAAVYKKRPKNVPPVLPQLLLPVPRDSSINIIDTSSSPKDGYKRAKEFHSADVVVLTYACDCTDTIQKLRSYWLPELRRLEVKVPIVIVGCKVDLMLDEQLVGLEEEEEISTILNEFHEIETCIRCSSHKLTHITDVFQFASGAIRYADVEDLFSTAPDCPWTEFSYMNAASTAALGDFTLNRFLSEWVLMTLLEPAKSFEYLKYIMYHGDAASAIRLTRMRRIDRQKRKSKRNVYQCFVFGPKKAGKTTLLDSFLGRPFSGASISTTEEIYAVNVVDRTAGSQKFLVLREIPEAKVKYLLSDRQSLATCDVALFMYDSTDESSFKKTAKLLRKVARHGEETCFQVPSLIVSAKDDMSSYTTSIQDSARLSEDMGIDVPVRFSARSGDISHIFQSIVTAAEHPHLGIPKTGAGGAVTIWKQDNHYHPDHRPDYIALGSLLFGAVAYIVGAVIYDYVY